MREPLRSLRVVRIAGAVLLLVLGAGISWGALAVAQSDTVYYACVNQSSGAIKMVAEGSSCAANEDLINWGQQGPQGDQGPQGEPGPQGEQGPAGPELIRTRTGWIFGETFDQWGRGATVRNLGTGHWEITLEAGTFPFPVDNPSDSEDGFPSIQLTSYRSDSPVEVANAVWWGTGSLVFEAECVDGTDCWFTYQVTQSIPETVNAAGRQSIDGTDAITLPTHPQPGSARALHSAVITGPATPSRLWRAEDEPVGDDRRPPTNPE